MKLDFLRHTASRYTLTGLLCLAAFTSLPARAQDDADKLALGKKRRWCMDTAQAFC